MSGLQGPVYTDRQRQHCDDTRDTALIENKGVTPERVATHIWGNPILFNRSSIASIVTALKLTLSVSGS